MRGFSLLWSGQLVSLFGDRIHQTAMIMLVFSLGSSSAAMAAVWLAAFLPTVVVGPALGAWVDRVDQRRVLIGMDLARAAMVAAIPLAASVSFWATVPILVALGIASAAFSPARFAVVARAVERDDLVTASASLMLAETVADLVGYPLAGAIVVVLAAHLPMAFYLDSGSYVLSALAITAAGIGRRPVAAYATAAAEAGQAGVRAAWRFLRHESTLFANTLQGVVGQTSSGFFWVLMPLYATGFVAASSHIAPGASFSILQTSIGVGCLVGGFAVGGVGHRVKKGWLVTAGYVSTGLLMAAFAFSGSIVLSALIMLGGGVANMAYIIPSQALFGARVPDHMMARVVSIRSAMVAAAYVVGISAAGFLGDRLGIAAVLVGAGLFEAATGLLGLLSPAVRDAD
jgi:MFS family permease